MTLSQVAPEHRKQALEILVEDPSLIDGFIERMKRKRVALQSKDGAAISAVLLQERKAISSFLDRLKTDVLQHQLE